MLKYARMRRTFHIDLDFSDDYFVESLNVESGLPSHVYPETRWE